MTGSTTPDGGQSPSVRDTLEFGRVAEFSDALFAIALTLLVFTLDASAVSLDRLDGVLVDQTGALIGLVLPCHGEEHGNRRPASVWPHAALRQPSWRRSARGRLRTRWLPRR